MDRNKLRVGMRNIKTALAIFVCLLIYQFVPGDASYAAMAALITMQSTLEESWEQARNRLLGTLIGGLAGAGFVSVWTLGVHPMLRLFAVSIGVTILIFLCNLIGRRGTIVMGCVTFLAIVISPVVGNVWIHSLTRMVNNAVGILVAIGINLGIRPPKEQPPEGEPQDALQEPPLQPALDAGEPCAPVEPGAEASTEPPRTPLPLSGEHTDQP